MKKTNKLLNKKYKTTKIKVIYMYVLKTYANTLVSKIHISQSIALSVKCKEVRKKDNFRCVETKSAKLHWRQVSFNDQSLFAEI